MRNLLFLLQTISVFQNMNFGDANSSDENVRQEKKRRYSRWTREYEAELVDIYRETASNERYQFKRIRKNWDKLHPDSNITDSALYKKVLRISLEANARDKRSRTNFTWDGGKYEELADIYLKTYPYNKTNPLKIGDEWARRYPEYPKYNSSYLVTRVRKYLKNRPLGTEAGVPKRLFEWTDKHDSDLYHIYHATLPEERQQPIHMHRIWADLHPDLRDLTYDQMAERTNYLKRNLPNKYFPWTNEQNQELLRIYHNTNPNKANQGQRIYEIWSKIHSRYSFMTPYYLQVHASSLAHHEEMKAKERRKNSKITDEQKANLVEMYRRLAKRHRPLYDFHKAWVREYPSLAYLTPPNLTYRAKKLIQKDTSSNLGVTEGEQSSENPLRKHRKYCKYTPEEKNELLATFLQTNPQEHRHYKRLYETWIQKYKNAGDIKGASLKAMIRRWIQRDSNKRSEASLVIPKDEVMSDSSPTASEELQ